MVLMLYRAVSQSGNETSESSSGRVQQATKVIPKIARLLALVLVLAVGSNLELLACSTFVLREGDQLLFGRNYDYRVGSGLVCVNQRHVRKRPPLVPVGSPPFWVSNYGSLTFNQYGKELPTDGMNEAGLVVTLLWLDGTSYPPPDQRPEVGELSWVQYQLDNCATVQEVIQTDQVIRISQDSSPLHFLVCDASGDAAAIEFLDGRMVASRGDNLPVPALTNSPYHECIQYLGEHEGFGGDLPIPTSSSSRDRFVRLADWLRSYQPGQFSSVEYAFGALSSVAQGSTQWRIVFDLANRQIHFMTRQTPKRRTLRLDAFDYACAPFRSKLIDVDVDGEGDISPYFQGYSDQANFDLLWKTYQVINPSIPISFLRSLAEFPGTLRCDRGEIPRRDNRAGGGSRLRSWR
jgi:penicillin V acylase-like amidase (Ntn superfamily)